MKSLYHTRILRVGLIILLAGLAVASGSALARLSSPASEPGGDISTVVMENPSYVSGDPEFDGKMPPDENPPLGSIKNTTQFSYYTVSGATLRGRSSATQYVYQGNGCLYTTAGVDTQRIVNTELNLPQGAVIKFLRVYYNDTNPNSGVDGYLTSYAPGQSAIDLTRAIPPDAFKDGFGFTVSPEITETINNTDHAYTLIGYPDENNIANQVCGLRIAYLPPYRGTVYIPTIHR